MSHRQSSIGNESTEHRPADNAVENCFFFLLLGNLMIQIIGHSERMNTQASTAGKKNFILNVRISKQKKNNNAEMINQQDNDTSFISGPG